MAHLKVYMKHIENLVKALPMDDVKFITQLTSNGILPDSVAAHIESLPTQSDKADYYLKKVIKPALDINETAEFKKLITVMEKCGYSHVKTMANKMKSDLEKELKGTYVCNSCVCMYVTYEISIYTLICIIPL